MSMVGRKKSNQSEILLISIFQLNGDLNPLRSPLATLKKTIKPFIRILNHIFEFENSNSEGVQILEGDDTHNRMKAACILTRKAESQERTMSSIRQSKSSKVLPRIA